MLAKHTKNSIATFSGKFIEPLNPDYETIDIVDIAHGLSNICRYGGQSREFYSVAQHCIYVSYNTLPENALNGLLHDGSEAYLGDVCRPLKYQEQYQFYRDVEDVLQTMIYQKYGKVPDGELDAGIFYDVEYESKDIKNADTSMLSIEQQHLFNHHWSPKLQWSYLKYQGKELLDVFDIWTPNVAEYRFMERFKELGGCL
jgi:hypothetical protein